MGAEQQWLVKSSDSILGPFEFDQVVKNIFNGDIHLLDEIKGPFERWRPIKDHSLFAAAIEKLKASTQQRREHTMTATVDLGTQTDLTGGQTVSVTDVEESTTGDLPPIDRRTYQEHETYAARPQAVIEDGTSVYSQDPSRAPRGRRSPIVFILSFLALVAIGVSYLIYEFKQTHLIEQKISAYSQLTDSALDYVRIGEYQKALKNFNLAYSISPKDPNLLIEMAPLAIQFEGQFERTQSQMENLLATTNQRALKKMAHTALGLSFSYRNRFAEALAAYDMALSLDSQFLPALVNKALGLMKMEKWDQASALMRSAVSEYPDEPITHFLYIRSLWEKGLHLKDTASLKELVSVADQFPQRFFDFRQEVLFLVALAQSQLGVSSEKMIEAVQSFLEVDSELTSLHVHKTLIDFQAFNWIDFSKQCPTLISSVQAPLDQALRGFCLLKIGQAMDAQHIFEKLLQENPHNGILHSLHISTLIRARDLKRAKLSLSQMAEMDRPQSVVDSLLRGCLVEGDMGCSAEILKSQHGKHLASLYFQWGAATIEYTNSRKRAKAAMKEGLKLSSQFAPLLKMERKF